MTPALGTKRLYPGPELDSYLSAFAAKVEAEDPQWRNGESAIKPSNTYSHRAKSYRVRPIIQYTRDGQRIEWPSMTAAAEATGVKLDSISDATCNCHPTRDGSRWVREDRL